MSTREALKWFMYLISALTQRVAKLYVLSTRDRDQMRWRTVVRVDGFFPSSVLGKYLAVACYALRKIYTFLYKSW